MVKKMIVKIGDLSYLVDSPDLQKELRDRVTKKMTEEAESLFKKEWLGVIEQRDLGSIKAEDLVILYESLLKQDVVVNPLNASKETCPDRHARLAIGRSKPLTLGPECEAVCLTCGTKGIVYSGAGSESEYVSLKHDRNVVVRRGEPGSES